MALCASDSGTLFQFLYGIFDVWVGFLYIYVMHSIILKSSIFKNDLVIFLLGRLFKSGGRPNKFPAI